ncbi:MAG: hypothetical protein H8K03_01020 [Nitrospira sp.]|jgi:hypothetical protein|nr:hypothetical protein [Nitrospira sp. BO4]
MRVFSVTELSAEILEQVGAQEWEVQEQAEMSGCSIEGEGRGSSMDLAVAV